MGDRLRGLIPVLLGIAMLTALQLWSSIDPAVLRPEPPEGFPASGTLLANPLSCLLPLLTVGAVVLIVVGVGQLLLPSDDFRARELRRGQQHERDPDGGPNLIP